MAKKIQESKEKKALKAMSGTRKDKKKWGDGKKKEEVHKIVTVSEDLLSKVRKDVGRASVVTRYMVGSRHNLNLGVAENILRHLSEEGVIERVRGNSRMTMYAGCASQEQ
ncbi:40S ribosomal protein S25-like protein [Encephalitozoon romaleae SJ-2008]|uniref:40S ribosomal protein S25 n=1 Tax=Encephalitozoon romaleae (strain SJ-2008) TaxID=1178016 RepID=I7ANZ9_ENCRO|nr:40S ribosomal protein S25-like protein [Encephalitozoon romaleae SJ-2008]XP_009265021.1 40S ribosomal protein S25-like protein [Encephalitozoon romaleae SJ-2008]AFN83521.1 40S ribosomal protein S25-like protein [Encephalitozoon romaleae SJ-2008]AFN83524.1 40S ribosomal protein S25-like protein [Encephalitozoon romaleae SJ-2008]